MFSLVVHWEKIDDQYHGNIYEIQWYGFARYLPKHGNIKEIL